MRTKEASFVTTIRIPASLYQKIQQESERKELSINNTILEALKQIFDKTGDK